MGSGLGGATRTRRSSSAGSRFIKIVVGAVVTVGLWAAITIGFKLPNYMLPDPLSVARALVDHRQMLAINAAVTAFEIVVGLIVGLIAGTATALAVAASTRIKDVVLPVVVVTQSLPVFAIAPILVIWLGFGMASKIVMAALIIYFPIATAYAEAMLRVPSELMDLARLHGASNAQALWLVRAPGGFLGLVSGVKVAATVAPIGAVVGEWVGASHGLGYVMLHANARLQTDVLFAAIFILAVLALTVRSVVDRIVDRLMPWQQAV